MIINQKLRKKALRRADILRLFKKSYWVYIAMFILGFTGMLVTHSGIFGIFFISSVLLAMLTLVAQEIFIKEIEGNKPLTLKQRKRTVFVLDVVKEKAYFEVRYLKPGIKFKECV